MIDVDYPYSIEYGSHMLLRSVALSSKILTGKDMRDKLTQKELKFSIAYASNGNATESAKLAGYAVPSASQAGHKLMRKGSVIREIEKRVEDFQLAQGITKSGILSDLIRLYNHALEAESHGVC